MGSTTSLPSLPEDCHQFVVSVQIANQLNIFHGTEEVLSLFFRTLNEKYPPGLAVAKPPKLSKTLVQKLRLRGHPFHSYHETTGLQAIDIYGQYFLCHVLSDLFNDGWRLLASADITRSGDLVAWFFGESHSSNNSSCRIISLSLFSHDKIRLVNGTPEMRPMLRDAIQTWLEISDKGDGQFLLENDTYELHLVGWPWRTTVAEESIKATKAILESIKVFDRAGYRFYGTASGDCIFFQEQKNVGGERHKERMVISLLASDLLRLIDAPEDVVDCVRELIGDIKGSNHVIKEQPQRGAWDFSLYGSPWTEGSSGEAFTTRMMITSLLQKLRQLGWRPFCSLDISRRQNDKISIVFERCEPDKLVHICLAPLETDRLSLINGNDELALKIASIIEEHWRFGVYKETSRAHFWEWKLHGEPWEAKGGIEYRSARHLMCVLLFELGKIGFEFLFAADVASKFIRSPTTGADTAADAQSWFLALTK